MSRNGATNSYASIAARNSINEVVDQILKKYQLSTEISKINNDDGDKLQKAFIEIGETMFDKNSLPLDYMKHFIIGKGKTKYFELAELFAEDKNVRRRVYSEVTRRSLKVKTIAETARADKSCTKVEGGIDPVITIFQKNYETVKWWGALGTFPITYTPAATMRNKESRFPVIIKGENLYQWHPDEDRTSKKVHQIGARLVQIRKADNFVIRGKPVLVMVDPQHKDILKLTTMTQENPQVSLANAFRRYSKALENHKIEVLKGLYDAL